MENVKKYKITIIITTLITLLPILFGLIVWNRLPEQIATHWGADGQADGYSGKTFAVFGMPCILAVLQLFVSFITLNDPKLSPLMTLSGVISTKNRSHWYSGSFRSCRLS